MNLDRYAKDIAKAVKFYRQNKIGNLQIYLENSFEFIPAFFAALICDLKPLVLTSKNKDGGSYFLNSFDEISKINAENIDINLKSDSIFYLKTSGSSGVAKIVEKKLSQMIKESQMLADTFEWGDEFLASVSHQHLFGLTFKIFLPLILDKEIDPNFLNYPEFIYEKDLKNKTLISSPTILNSLLQNPKKQKLGELKNIVCAGAKLDDQIQKELRDISDIINIYGSTETGVIAADNGNGMQIFKDVNAKIDETLVVKSPWCEYFKTSDLARIENNNLILLGRNDRIIKINEKRISLDMIESLVKQNNLIDDCVARFYEGRVRVILTLSKKGKIEFRQNGKKSISGKIKEILKNDYKNTIRNFKIVTQIPRNSQGKFTKQQFEPLLKSKEKLKFRLIQKYKNFAIFESFIDYGLFYFDGHFMDFPLIPGFIQLEAICSLSSELGIKIPDITKFQAIKFSGFLRPGDTAKFELEVKNNKLYFKVFANGKMCASGRICIS